MTVFVSWNNYIYYRINVALISQKKKSYVFAKTLVINDLKLEIFFVHTIDKQQMEIIKFDIFRPEWLTYFFSLSNIFFFSILINLVRINFNNLCTTELLQQLIYFLGEVQLFCNNAALRLILGPSILMGIIVWRRETSTN